MLRTMESTEESVTFGSFMQYGWGSGETAVDSSKALGGLEKVCSQVDIMQNLMSLHLLEESFVAQPFLSLF